MEDNSKVCERYPQDCHSDEDGEWCEYMRSCGRNACGGLNWDSDVRKGLMRRVVERVKEFLR